MDGSDGDSVTTETEAKRTLSPEHLARLQEGRQKALQERQARRQPITPADGTPPRAEPFSFPWRQKIEDPEGAIPRLVGLADVKEVTEGYWPLILRRYPDARKEMVRGYFALASRGERHRLYRTDTSISLFEMRQTPFEPLPIVHTMLCEGRDAKAMMDAAMAWAKDIQAVYFDDGHGRWDLRERQALSS